MNFEQWREQVQQNLGYLQGKVRTAEAQHTTIHGEHSAIRRDIEQLKRDLANMSAAAGGLSGPSSGATVSTDAKGRSLVKLNDQPLVKYIDEIPGRRIPFDFQVNIAIGANTTTAQPGTDTVSQDGPFVATARLVTFQSALTFQRTDPETQNRVNFQGRSFGRFRPTSSVWDLNDAQAGVFSPVAGVAFPGTGAPIFASASNHASFRSMEFDGVFEFFNKGSAYPRQRQQVPSPFYSTQLNSPFPLAAFDFFERGETLEWRVTPTHVNNPTSGNVSAFAGAITPTLQSQYDVHEGIADPLLAPEPAEDVITRVPDGIITIGFHGFRIIQPPGPVAMV